MTVKEVESKANSFEDEKIAEVYKRYSELLLSNNAVDFNDLIGMPIKLFKKNAALLKQYQQSWKYILVDEFQDTNFIQNKWNLLALEHKNICCVGDDDQSIYGWRGAKIENIQRFTEDFSDKPSKLS